MIVHRVCGTALAAAFFALATAAPAAAESAGTNAGLLGWATFPSYSTAKPGPDRPVVIGRVPNPQGPAGDLPAPPKLTAAPKAPQPALNGYANITANGTSLDPQGSANHAYGSYRLIRPKPDQTKSALKAK